MGYHHTRKYLDGLLNIGIRYFEHMVKVSEYDKDITTDQAMAP